jgi:hypothetical protein
VTIEPGGTQIQNYKCKEQHLQNFIFP